MMVFRWYNLYLIKPQILVEGVMESSEMKERSVMVVKAETQEYPVGKVGKQTQHKLCY